MKWFFRAMVVAACLVAVTLSGCQRDEVVVRARAKNHTISVRLTNTKEPQRFIVRFDSSKKEVVVDSLTTNKVLRASVGQDSGWYQQGSSTQSVNGRTMPAEDALVAEGIQIELGPNESVEYTLHFRPYGTLPR